MLICLMLGFLLMYCVILIVNIVTILLGIGFVMLLPELGFRKFEFWPVVADGLCWFAEYIRQHSPKIEIVNSPS